MSCVIVTYHDKDCPEMTSILCMDEVISNINLWCHAVCIGSSCHIYLTHRHTHTHTHPFNGPFPGLPR